MFGKKLSPKKQGISFEDSQEKRRRRRRYFLRFSVGGAVFAILLFAAWVLLRSPVFRLDKVVVEGNKTVSEDAITDILKSRIVRGSWSRRWLGIRNMLAWPASLGADDLKLIPLVRSVSITKNYKNRTLTALVEEREPYGIWCFHQAQTNADSTQTGADNAQTKSASCWWFDAEGVVFKRAFAAEGNLLKVVNDYSQPPRGLGEKILPEEFVPNLISILQMLQKSSLSVREVRLEDVNKAEVVVRTHTGPKLYLSLRFPADDALSVIKSLSEKAGFKDLEYIDFRVRDRAYYK